MFLAYDASGGVEVPRPRVVTQPFPSLEHFVKLGGSQSLYVGVESNEAPVIGDDLLDSSLDEHHLGDPLAVRITRAPPWQVPPMRVVPAEEAPSDLSAGWLSLGGRGARRGARGHA